MGVSKGSSVCSLLMSDLEDRFRQHCHGGRWPRLSSGGQCSWRDTAPWCKAGRGSLRTRRDTGLCLQVLSLYHQALQPSSHVTRLFLPHSTGDPPCLSTQLLLHLPESPSAWFYKDMDWGGGYRDQHWLKEAFTRIRGLTGSHGLSVVCTALLPKATIRSDNSNHIESGDGSLNVWT